MKRTHDHKSPVCLREIIGETLVVCQRTERRDLVFEGQRQTKPLSNMAMSMILRRMKISNANVHGFRSTFRDWVEDVSNIPPALAEAALAHIKEIKPNGRTDGRTLAQKRPSAYGSMGQSLWIPSPKEELLRRWHAAPGNAISPSSSGRIRCPTELDGGRTCKIGWHSRGRRFDSDWLHQIFEDNQTVKATNGKLGLKEKVIKTYKEKPANFAVENPHQP